MRIPLGSVDAAARTLSLGPQPGRILRSPHRASGSTPRTCLPELDSPGEWYLDRDTGDPLLLAAGAAVVGPGRRLRRPRPGPPQRRLARHLPRPADRGRTRQRRRRQGRRQRARRRLHDPQHGQLGGEGLRRHRARRRRLRHLPDGPGRHPPRRRRPQDADPRRALRRQQPHPPHRPLGPGLPAGRSRSSASATAPRTT